MFLTNRFLLVLFLFTFFQNIIFNDLVRQFKTEWVKARIQLMVYVDKITNADTENSLSKEHKALMETNIFM